MAIIDFIRSKLRDYENFVTQNADIKRQERLKSQVGGLVQSLPRPIQKLGEGFVEGSTVGLYDAPIAPSTTGTEKLAYTVGNVAGLLNPLNPINKLGVFAKLGTLGSKVATAGVSAIAPKLIAPTAGKVAGFIGQKALPAIGAEIAQEAAYAGAKKALGQEYSPMQGLAFGLGIRGLAGGVAPALKLGIKGQAKGQAPLFTEPAITPQGKVAIKSPTYRAEPTAQTLAKMEKATNLAREKTIKAEYRDWSGAIKAREGLRTGKSFVKDVIAGIKSTKSPLANTKGLKDISGWYGQTRDLYRNFKAAYGKRIGDASRLMLNPFDRAKSQFIDEQTKWANELKTKIVDGLGIKKGSKLSEAVQNWGEGNINLNQLKTAHPKDYQKVIEADKWFRGAYDYWLDEVNRVRARIYPNDPSKIIPKRKDYYRHFKELREGLHGVLDVFDSPAGLPQDVAGQTRFAHPLAAALSFAKRRLGFKTKVDAVGGFLDYLPSAAYAKNIAPQIGKFRRLADELEQFGAGKNQPKVTNFVKYLRDFADDLSGVDDPITAYFKNFLSKKVVNGIGIFNRQIKLNTVVFNLSSSVAQSANIPQGIASAGPINSAKGLGRTFAGMFMRNNPMKQSGFLKERYFNIYDQFDTGLLANSWKMGRWITGVLDEVGTKFIWNAHYEQALQKGIANPIKYADNITRNLVAGRGIGELPLIHKNKLAQILLPFTLEVGNLHHVIGDMVGEKQFGRLASLVFMNYVYNRAIEKTGREPILLDPIQATIDAARTFREETDKKQGAFKATGRLTGEYLGSFPGAQYPAALYPKYGGEFLGTQFPTRKEFFGRTDPARFGNSLLLSKGLNDPLYRLIPPFGGVQLQKTIEGKKAYDQGYSETDKGLVRFPIQEGALSELKNVLFGQYSTPEARKYFESGTGPLGKNQSEAFKTLDTEQRKEYYNNLLELRRMKNLQDKIKEGLMKGEDVTDLIKKVSAAGITPSDTQEQEIEAPAIDQIGEVPTTDTQGIIGEVSAAEDTPQSHIQAETENYVAKAKVELTGEPIETSSKILYINENGGVSSVNKSKLEEINKLPTSNKYETGIKESKQYSAAATILDNTMLSDEYKQKALTLLGVDPTKAAYYRVANDNNNLKTMFMLDSVNKIKAQGGTDQDVLLELLKQRTEVNGQMIASDGVLANLVDEGIITKEQAKQIKKYKMVDGKLTSTATTGTGKKVKIKKIKAPKPIKIKIAKVKLKTLKMPKPKKPTLKSLKIAKPTRIKLKTIK